MTYDVLPWHGALLAKILDIGISQRLRFADSDAGYKELTRSDMNLRGPFEQGRFISALRAWQQVLENISNGATADDDEWLIQQGRLKM